MAEKKIEIRIAAVGGDQAAAQIGKVATATDAAADSVKKMTREELLGPELTEFFDTARVKADMMNDSVKDLGGSMDQNVGAIDMRIRAEAVARLGNAMGSVADFTKKTADQLRESSPEMADALDGVSNNLGRFADMTEGAARGMAAGGPLFAGIGAITGLLKEDLKSALGEAVESLQNLALAEQRAEDQANAYFKMLAMGPEAYADAIESADNYKKTTDELSRSLDVQTTALKNRNAVLNAEAGAAAAERDAADAERIRGGAAPEDVKAERAQFDAQQKIDALQRKLQEVAADEAAARQRLGQEGENLRTVQNDPRGVDPVVLGKQQDALAKARRDAEDAAERTATQRRITEAQIRETNTDVRTKVGGLQDSKTQRLAREQQAAEEKARREAERQQREQQSDMLGGMRGGLDDMASAGADRFNDAAGKLGSKDPLRRTLDNIAKKLSDGTNEAELAKIEQEFAQATRGLGGSTIRALQTMLTAQLEQSKKISQLEARIRNIR